ncbi:hypothetical protein RHGRI_027269 [Rhododendron griersonianum]|uniref:Peptidase M1 membrane alanine aminopeptidase domain-containing protein n=1 Tax=Rhododendron griersonianum TaxID=479676 RepID=A0AAV6IZC7_9ERIC|nr:hypothetical protein RHGRI_027269 [Rhododendron griersonianum]
MEENTIFNSKLVLASPETATDADYAAILGVIGHEVVLLLHMQYFHNWTGNRVTCRDWFQLSLKEGLTVFRDQFCGREGTVLMVTGRGRPLAHALSQSGQYAPLMLFDCRGYEPVEFAFGSGWKVESMDDDDERITNVRGRL